MRHERLLEPIDEKEPCGPDLDEVGDSEYMNYVLPAEERVPERYYDKLSGEPFDRTQIDLKSELQAIDALLARSRDLRLICLEARFQSFVGQFADFAGCLQAAAGLVERFWEDVHPRGEAGDFTFRQNVLAALDDWAKIIQPLQHLPLVRDRRLGPVTFRHYAVASGAAQPREDETGPGTGEILQALGNADNADQAKANFEALSGARAALSSIRNSFIANAGYEYAPGFDRLDDFLKQAGELIARARPDLLAAAGPAVADAAESPPAAGAAEAGDGPAAASPAPAAAASPAIADQADAVAALLAAESYFAAREPSAPSLILVHQARMLIGRPLVEAIETLLPEMADRAVVRFDGDGNFQLAMPQMRTLSERIVNGSAAEGEELPRSFSASTRAEAEALMAGVESHFRKAEPSSPVPMLLGKARSYLGRDFVMILKDLIKEQE